MKHFRISLKGESALLHHFDNITWAETMSKWAEVPENRKVSVPGDDRSPAWRWIGNLYINAGKVCIPSDNLMTMFREGGAKCPTGTGKGSYKRQTQSGIIVDQIGWDLHGSKGPIEAKPILALTEEDDFSAHEKVAEKLGFVLFVKRARIGNAKHIRVRPRFDEWSTSGTVTVTDETISQEILARILAAAGRYCGLCDWRPSSPKSPGPFGRFSAAVESVKA